MEENLTCDKFEPVLTGNMIEAEREIENNSQKDEEKMMHEMQKSEKEMTREMCYKRLEHLLNRSNFYTQFLLKRMKEQQEQKEANSKRQAKEKNVQPVSETRKSTRQTRKQNEERKHTVLKEENNKSNTRRSKSKFADLSENNKKSSKHNCTSQVEIFKENSQSETKRKHSTLDIGSYFTEESLAKRAKTQETEANKNDSKDEISVDTFSRTINSEKVSDRQPKLFSGGVMRPYQLDGLDWLKLLYENGVNGILGDEMGLGKTIQCIALIAHLVDMGVPGPYLVCGPLSTLPNWVMEFERFAPQIPVVLYHGNQEERCELAKQIGKTSSVNGKQTKPVVITSYELAMRDRPQLQKHSWRFLIIDEGQRIKNYNCRLVRELKKYDSANRLLLTGTPLQNNLSELWSLLNFLLPEIFDDLAVFQSWFDVKMLCDDRNDQKIIAQEKEKQIIFKLHQILTPFLLRRVKSDVELNIPPKREMLVYAPLSSKQEIYYRAAVNKTIESLVYEPKEEEAVVFNEKGRPERRCSKNIDYKEMLESLDDTDDENQCFDSIINQNIHDENLCFDSIINPSKTSVSSSQDLDQVPKLSVVTLSIRNLMVLLRKVCNHPYLIDYPLDPSTMQYLVNDNLINCSGKLHILDMMLKRLKTLGHKVLIFSQMTKLLDILEDFCNFKEYSFCRLDGTLKIQERKEQIQAFNTDPDVFIFLLSTRAGGLGINLTAADTVIIYDSDWNPQCDLQAQDRCHRIGQHRPVVVYRLVTAGTIDEEIVQRAASKRKLEKMIIHKGKFKSGRASIESSLSARMNSNELLEILKSKDYQKAVYSNGQVFSESQLDMILDRSDLIRSMQNSNETPSKIQDVENVFKVISNDCDTDIQM
ncbi:Lymphoid-specific helicase [Nymphon striatum]|nr:Lymphoid-specific helicase [Nymphon striatum]